MIVRRPFKGTWFYEWQIGALVIQVRHTKPLHGDGRHALFGIWRDPHWRRG